MPVSDDASEGKIEYIWDEEKRQTNINKHGIYLAEIPRLFKKNHWIEDYDTLHSEGEDRWRVLGLLDGNVVYCVYTQRESTRRIITARLATNAE